MGNYFDIAKDGLGTELSSLKNTKFYCVSKSGSNGCKWQHGASIAYYGDKFYLSWGRNAGEENTKGEQCVVFSTTDFATYQLETELIDDGDMGYSHGVIYAKGENLYLFAPYFGGSDRQSPTGIHFKNLSMRGFVKTQAGWDRLNFELDDFWPLQEPIKLQNGNYVMPGINGLWQSAVALSSGEDFTSWTLVVPPYGENTAFTETALIARGDEVTLYVRNERATDKDNVTAGVSVSHDGAKTFSLIAESNMPANTSKIYAGTLSSGERYIISNGKKGANRNRGALTIAIEEDGLFSKIYKIRDREIPPALKETYFELDEQEAMSYPFALEKDGKLYVIYSSFMSRGCNYNNIELAVLDLSEITGR